MAVALVLVLLSTTARADAQASDLAGQRVAVLEVTGDVPVAQLKRLADEIRAGAFDALSPRGALVVTREATLAILREMGADCAEGECEIDTLRALSAHLGIVADLSRGDGRAVLSVKVLDVGSGALRAIFDVKAASLLQLLPLTRGAVAEHLKTALRASSLPPDATGAPAEPRALVEKALGPLRVAQKTPLPAAVTRACHRVLTDERACDTARLASMLHIVRRVSVHETMEIDGSLNGNLDIGCFESVTISLRPRSRARLDLSRARLYAAGYEYELAPPRAKSRAIWAEARVPSVVELTASLDGGRRCLAHDFDDSPIRVEVPVETDGSLERIVLVWRATVEPIDERSAMLALERPARPSTWPEAPSYSPSFVSLTFVGLAVVFTTLHFGFVSSAVAIDALPHGLAVARAVPLMLAFGSAPLGALAVVTTLASGGWGIYEFLRWTSFRRDDARFARLTRYEKRLAELATSMGDGANEE